MIKTLTVLICDDNQYFASGLKIYLKEWFEKKLITVHISTNFALHTRANIIFIARNQLSPYRLCALNQQNSLSQTPLCIIEDKKYDTPEKSHLLPSIPWANQISSTISCELLENELSQLLIKLKTDLKPTRSVASNISICYRLTYRETQILRYLARGISHATVARYLHISEKTVSAHKRNIMAKLNIRRTTELNYWLINEGFVRHPSPQPVLSKH